MINQLRGHHLSPPVGMLGGSVICHQYPVKAYIIMSISYIVRQVIVKDPFVDFDKIETAGPV
jgi:hypothetical protein